MLTGAPASIASEMVSPLLVDTRNGLLCGEMAGMAALSLVVVQVGWVEQLLPHGVEQAADDGGCRAQVGQDDQQDLGGARGDKTGSDVPQHQPGKAGYGNR